MESKFEYTMSYASQIMQIRTTKCNTLLALVLKNSNLIVFDFNSGINNNIYSFQEC